jgi:uncharacterized protein
MFSWDERKNAANRKKHGISFELAEKVFDDPFQVNRLERIVEGEERWQTIGSVRGRVLLLVAHTWEDLESGETHIRIISARQANRQERTVYDEGHE